jgi:hypothetical protein
MCQVNSHSGRGLPPRKITWFIAVSKEIAVKERYIARTSHYSGRLNSVERYLSHSLYRYYTFNSLQRPFF